MNIIIKGASGFMGLFDTGAETFVSWVSGIVPKVLLLLILMNTIIALPLVIASVILLVREKPEKSS